MVLVSACGRKAPPMPPTAVEPPVVQKFQAHMEGVKLQLSWQIPECEGNNRNCLAGFYVYGSKENLSEAGCKDCPYQFKQVADIRLDIHPIDPKPGVTYEAPLEKGFRYYYKVSCYTDNGNEGEFSKVVTIDY
jgi:hypothetical protein